MYFPLSVEFLCLSLLCYALLCVLSSFAIILKRKRELVSLSLLSCGCLVAVNALWLFIKVILNPEVHCLLSARSVYISSDISLSKGHLGSSGDGGAYKMN